MQGGPAQRSSASLSRRDQLGQRQIERRGDIEQRQHLAFASREFETPKGVHIHSRLVRERLLGQVPLLAASPNLGTKLIEDGS